MSQILIEAKRRAPGGKNANRRLRTAGSIPAVLYGRGREPVPLSVAPKAIVDILYSESGQNTIFSLSVDGGERANAMVKEYQLDPVKGRLIHTDFVQIAMDRLLEVSVNIELVGEAEGVKAGGLLDFVTRSIDLECLPADIPDSIKVDVGHLKINDYVRVKNIEFDSKIKVLTDPEVVIVTISPPLKEEVAPVEVAPAEAAEPEVIKKGKVTEEGAEEEAKKE
jgi:large subunit ribosomal protein L25